MKKLLIYVALCLSLFTSVCSCEAQVYTNNYYGFTFNYPDNYAPIYNPNVIFQVQNGDSEFHVLINEKLVSQLYGADEETILNKIIDKFYADAAADAYAPFKFRVLKHKLTWTTDNRHRVAVFHYAMITPSGTKMFCSLGSVLSKGRIYDIYFVDPNPSASLIGVAETCVRSFSDI
jgi:hypothetical protein